MIIVSVNLFTFNIKHKLIIGMKSIIFKVLLTLIGRGYRESTPTRM